MNNKAGGYDAWDSDAPIYAWSLDAPTGSQGGFPIAAAPAAGDALVSIDGSPLQPAVAGAPGPDVFASTDISPVQPAAAGTPGPDVFALDRTALVAATAVPPSIALISDYKAAQGDVIDFSSVLQASYAPLPADNVQLRVAEDAGAAFATLQLNAGSATSPFWLGLAKLDGVHLGDAVNISLDATHMVHLNATWLV
jgi:hypothetical protein